jgi:hypothetical protein
MVVFVAGSFALIMTCQFLANVANCGSQCDDMRLASVENSLGSIAIHFFLAAVGIFILAAEMNLSCIAYYFGFLAFRFGRGVTLIVCGFIAFSYSRVFVISLEVSEHAPHSSSLFPMLVGILASLVGILNVVVAMLPTCCTSLSVPADRLTIEFLAMHEAARHAKVKSSIERKAAPNVTMIDPEMGDCKSPRAKGTTAKGRKGKKEELKAQSTQIVIEENPFIKTTAPEVNPFIKGPDRC